MPYRSNKPAWVTPYRPGTRGKPPKGLNPMDATSVEPTLPQVMAERSKQGDKVGVRTSTRRPSSRTESETTFDAGGGQFTVNNTWINYTNGYAVFNENSARVDFQGEKSSTLYANPYQEQANPSLNSEVTSKTLCNVTSVDHILPVADNGNHTWVYEALSDIHAIQRKEIVANTGGGTATSNSVFTLDTWLRYHNRYLTCFAYAIELASRQAWSAQVPKSNLVLRDVATACALTNSLELRNKLARTLSQAALPMPLVKYLTWYFQVYKANDHDYCLDQFFCTREFAGAFLTNDSTGDRYSDYETKINNIISYVASGYDEYSKNFPQLTALIEEKTNQPYVNLRNATVPSNTTDYDADWNDIFNNTPSLVVSDDGLVSNKLHQPPRTAEGSNCPAAFRRDAQNVPNHVLASLGTNQTITGYNGLFRPEYLFGPGSTSEFSTDNSNKYAVYTDPSSVTGNKITRRSANIAASFMGNDFANVFSLDAFASYEHTISPKGEAAYLYEVTDTNTKMAARNFIFELFGVSN
jgi:hypothetical protein